MFLEGRMSEFKEFDGLSNDYRSIGKVFVKRAAVVYATPGAGGSGDTVRLILTTTHTLIVSAPWKDVCAWLSAD